MGSYVAVVQGGTGTRSRRSPTVWLYLRFPLSFGEVEELILERGVLVSHETARRRCAEFGQTRAGVQRRRRTHPVS